MTTCDDTRQITQQEREDGAAAARQTGVARALRPFGGDPTLANLIDYVNRELGPAVRQSRDKLNEVHQQVARNAPSANPLGFYFSADTTNADPTTGRIRLDASPENTATTIRVSEMNAQLQSVLPWLDVMAGGITFPIGTVTLMDAINPARYFRANLMSTIDQGSYWDLGIQIFESSSTDPFVDGEAVLLSFLPAAANGGVNLKGALMPAPGRDGEDGADGIPGIPGIQGIQGLMGFPGMPGRDGDDGQPGETGAPGISALSIPGTPGSPGMDGQDGNDGLDGVPGVMGPAGASGFPTNKIVNWLRLAQSTQTAGEWSSVVDILASNPATGTAGRRPSVALTDNGFPIARFATNDCLSWPLTSTTGDLTHRSYAFWARPSDLSGTQNTLICVFNGTGGASAEQLSLHVIGQALQALIVGSGTNGRLGTTGSVLAANTWTWIRMVYDYRPTTDAGKLKIYVNGVQQTLTFSNFGAGGAIGFLPAATGNALIGNVNDGTALFPYSGDLGANLWVLSDDLTPIEEAELMAFEEPTSTAGRAGIIGPPGQDASDAPEIYPVPGLPGQQGIQGLPGLSANPGLDGQDGQDGSDGFPGPMGLQGAAGIQGFQGNPGSDGVDGQDGLDGQQGPPGIQGVQGIAGLQGASGNDGADGADGEAGIPGLPGVQGIQGLIGLMGMPGSDGSDGIEGVMGPPAMPFGFGTPTGTAPARTAFVNATNAIAAPGFLQTSGIYQYLRSNSTNTALEWANLSAHGGFGGIIYSTGDQAFELANMAADTLKGNRTGSTAAPTDILIAALCGSNLDYDTANHRMRLTQRVATSVVCNPQNITADAQDVFTSTPYQYFRSSNDGTSVEFGPAPTADADQYQLRDDFTFFLFDATDSVVWGDTAWTGAFITSGAPSGLETSPAAPGVHPGEMIITTGTTSGGGYTIFKGTSVLHKLFNCSIVQELVWIVRLDVVTQVVVQCGLGENGVNTSVDGVGFFYAATTTAVTWQCYAIAASSALTSTIGSTVSAGTYYRLRAVRNAAGSWTFTVNGGSATTLAKNPSALVNFYNHIHTTNTTSKRLFTDYCHLFMGPLGR